MDGIFPSSHMENTIQLTTRFTQGPGLRPAGARPASQRDAGAVHGAPVGRRLARGRKCQRSRLVTHLNQGLKRLRGPLSAPKLRVLSAWIPALCSPLKRVTVSGQPAA